MVGANYMGGKRNSARARSKDVVGRAERRHFGKQRLASALYVMQENRIHPGAVTLSSVLPEIALAHAHRDASMYSGSTSSTEVLNGNRLYSSTSPRDTTRRNQSSKTLGVPDISDHMSMRAAVDRILQLPNLIGVSTPKHTITVYTERAQIQGTIKRPTDVHLDAKVQWSNVFANGKEPDGQHSEILSKRIFDSQSLYSQIPGHEPTGLVESSPDTRDGLAENSILTPSNLPGVYDATYLDPFADVGYPEAKWFTGAKHTAADGAEGPNTPPGAFHLLPRSSPFPPSSRSPPLPSIRPARSDSLSGEDVDCVDASPLHSVYQAILRQSSRGFPIREGLAGVGQARLTEEELETEQSGATRYNDGRTFLSTGNNGFQNASSGPGQDSVRVLTSQEVTEGDPLSDISFDFLSDPRPWETIGRILKLKPPESSQIRSVKVHFTKDREGVGYVSPQRPGACNDDSHVTLSADLPMLGLEISFVDDRTAINTTDSPCARNLTQPQFDEGSHAGADPHTHAHALQDNYSIPLVRYPENEPKQLPTAPAHVVATIAPEPDIAMMFDGPCLFGDSDLEEDE